MSWDLVESIKDETDLRMIMPFGLVVRPGDVVSVARDGNLELEGTAQSVLDIGAGSPREDGQAVDVFRQAGKDVSVQFRASGEASTLFPELPEASAKVDVKFAASRSWVLAITDRRLASLGEVHRFREPILRSYKRGVWRKDWALVTSVATAKAMTLLASKSNDTKVALTLKGDVEAGAAMEAKLTAGATIAAASKDLTKCILDRSAPVACTAIRVRDRWWSRPDVRPLGGPESDVSDEEFWIGIDAKEA